MLTTMLDFVKTEFDDLENHIICTGLEFIDFAKHSNLSFGFNSELSSANMTT